jgi:phosphatidate phosphatase APP1
MPGRVPILLSYYALSNGTEALIFGQVTSMQVNDLTFTDYSRRKTFRTLLSLYRTRAVSHQEVTLEYDTLSVNAKTDAFGFFLAKHKIESAESILQKATLSSGQPVQLIEGLYSRAIHQPATPYMVISDIDDTILHSHITRKILKFRTLMFTPVEKRKAVEPMKDLIKSIVAKGATAIYLSNSEQNLYPLIYRFLLHHDFPAGPLFLKQMRKLKDVIRYRKLPGPEVHKMKMLDEVIPLFSNKKFVLIGDNTQYDLSIYIAAAKKYPSTITDIFIRKVITPPHETRMIAELTETLAKLQIAFHYAEQFSDGLALKE